MGYKPKRYKLTWADGDLEGLEVLMRPATLGQMMEAQKMRDLADPDSGVTDMAAMEPVFRWLAEMLISWNVEDDDDQPVPATYEGIIAQDPDLIFGILNEFQQRITRVPRPLPSGSGSTPESPEDLQIPQVPLTVLQAS